MAIIPRLIVALSIFLFPIAQSFSVPLGGSISVVAPSSASIRVAPGVFQDLLLRPPNWGGGVGATGSFGAMINGQSAAINGIRGIGNSAIVNSAAKLAFRLGPSILAAVLLDMVWDAAQKQWTKPDYVGTHPQGKWCSGSNNCCRSQPEPVCQCQGTLYNIGMPFQSLQGGPNVYNCQWKRPDGSFTNIWSANFVQACPPGSQWDTETGLCLEVNRVPVSLGELTSAVTSALNSPNLLLAQANNIRNSSDPEAGIQNLLNLAGPVSTTTGPASVPSTSNTTTSTGPGGQTSTTTTYAPTLSYSDTSNVVNVSITTTTTITNPDNTTSTTTTTDTTTQPRDPDSITSETDKNDQEDFCAKYPTSAMCQPPVDICKEHPDSALCKPAKDFCEEHPDAISCKELGEPVQSDTENQEKTITWNKEMSDVGQCPQDIEFNALGKSYSLSWLPVCRLATGLRPFIIISAWLSAGIFLFGIVSRSD